MQTFTEAGGEAVNHARVVRLQKDAGGKICEAEIEDQLTGARTTIRARVFVNCTGPYSDHIREMATPGVEKRLRLSKGVHILLPLDERTTDAMVVPKTDDGRVIFAIPWLGRLLVGTTDDEVTHEEELVVKRSEAEYLLKQLNRFLSRPFVIEDIVGGFAGVRPLVSQGKGAKTKKLIREHEVEVDRESGLISVLGGKWTTYRAMAEDAVNAVQQQLGLPVGGCITRESHLSGSEGYSEAYPQTLVGFIWCGEGNGPSSFGEVRHPCGGGARPGERRPGTGAANCRRIPGDTSRDCLRSALRDGSHARRCAGTAHRLAVLQLASGDGGGSGCGCGDAARDGLGRC